MFSGLSPGGVSQGLVNCGAIMAEAGAQNDANQHVVTFEDVRVYFSPEEWELLDVAQKRLYYAVMRENFKLVASQGRAVSRYHLIPRPEPPRVPQAPGMVDIAPTVAEIIPESPGSGVCHKVEDKDASSEQGVSGRVSQVRTLKAGSSIQKSHPCDPLSKDIFHRTGQQGTCPEQQPYPRKSCGRTFWVTENLAQSRRQQNGETLSRTEKGQASSGKSGPSHMSKEACTRQEDAEDLASSGLGPHRATHNGKKPRRSTECDEAFHTAQGDYKCSQCGEAFSDKDKRVQHQKVHTEGKSCKCNECGELFSHSSDFLLHEKTHGKPTPSESSNHGECFSFDSSPRIQQDSHMGLRPNECAEYGKSFSTKYSLVQHQTSHTRAKPYECSEGGKAFGHRSTLTQHQEIHSGERPFVCSTCGGAFLHKRALTQHKKTHTGEKPYRCDACGKTFSRSSSMKEHKRIHSGIRPYGCSECGNTYITKSNLTKHKKVHSTARPMNNVNEGNSLVATPASVDTGDIRAEQDLRCLGNVGERREDAPIFLDM